ncbi:hypothetical protein J437_LFUL009570 [Ladona fulva]|uniref:Uncharacterized protein n=1 Tax=Ladona fulva TaxID=123851 RepID=A0A8K0P0M9_LADFU|nr:hypothetical protein J437_LFUL009570 [Ladona fulva]
MFNAIAVPFALKNILLLVLCEEATPQLAPPIRLHCPISPLINGAHSNRAFFRLALGRNLSHQRKRSCPTLVHIPVNMISGRVKFRWFQPYTVILAVQSVLAEVRPVPFHRRGAYSPYTIYNDEQNSSNSVREAIVNGEERSGGSRPKYPRNGSVGNHVRVLPIRHILRVRLLRPGVCVSLRHPLVPDLLLQLSAEEVISTDRHASGAAPSASRASSHSRIFGRNGHGASAAVQEASVSREVLVVQEASPEQYPRAERGRGRSRSHRQPLRRPFSRRRPWPIDPRDYMVARVAVSEVPVPPNAYQVHLANVSSMRQQPPNQVEERR